MKAVLRFLRVLASATVRLTLAAALLAGLPYALARLIGWPLPARLAWRGLQQFLISPLSDEAIIKGLACVAWLLWIIFAVSLVIEAAAAARGHAAPRLPVIGPFQAIAAFIIGATIMSSLQVPRTGPRAPQPLHAALTAATTVSGPLVPGTAATRNARAASRDEQQASPRVDHVVPGDNLWDIAQHDLGNGQDWHEIFRLNEGKPQPDGQRLTNPDLILPGWTLQLPAQPGATAHARPATHHRSAPSTSAHPRSPAPHGSRPAPAARARPAGHRQHNSPGVSLPSGTIIGLSLAIAAGLALTLARLHQRRRREPAPVPGTAPAEPELSPALRRIRQARLAAQHHHEDKDEDEDAGPVTYLPAPTMTPYEHDDIPPRDGPSTETINVAVSDDNEEIPLDLASVPGAGITGPGAADVIRAIAITLLARRSTDQAEVLLCGDDACRLLDPRGGPGLAGVPGLTAVPGPDDALNQLETEILHRRRLLDAGTSDDITSYRDLHPDEPLPTILAIAPANAARAGRLAAVLSIGQQLGITGILSGPWPAGATCQVTANGVVTNVTAPVQHLLDAQMYQLTQDETTEILATLARASGSEPAPHVSVPRVLSAPLAEPSAPDGKEPGVHVAVLGPFQLTAAGDPVLKGLRRKAAELLTYLAIHRGGATTDAVLDALWQDTPASRAAPLLHSATTNIRKILRDATGAGEAAFIIRAADELRIDQRLISTDLWQFQDALARAASDHDRHASLQNAADLWRGDLTPGIDSAWTDQHRETLRRDAVDTLARLAELTTPGDPEQALAYLERAITADRYQEPLYRRIMRLQADLGRPDAARRTYQLLESRLTDIETEPDETTAVLLNAILHPRNHL